MAHPVDSRPPARRDVRSAPGSPLSIRAARSTSTRRQPWSSTTPVRCLRRPRRPARPSRRVGAHTGRLSRISPSACRDPVLDTNVRRVLARIAIGEASRPTHPDQGERDLAAAWLPDDRADANPWNVASMELGALVCTRPHAASNARPAQCARPVPLAHRLRPPGIRRRKRAPGVCFGTDRKCGCILRSCAMTTPAPRADFDPCRPGPVDNCWSR